MTENEAQDWIVKTFGDDAHRQLTALVALVRTESAHQNLISASTLNSIWTRHIADSAQLVQLAGEIVGNWVDIGTGAGFPGLVVAILRNQPTILIEPRRRRSDFLTVATGALGLARRVTIFAAKVEAVKVDAAVISARAVAALAAVLNSAEHISSDETHWLLPKGRHACEEVAEAQRSWHGVFHVEHSLTDPESLIVIASGVSRR